MTEVLNLDGSKIDWTRPQDPTRKVKWSDDSVSWGPVTGSLRTISHLDWMSKKSEKNFGQKIIVIQPPYNTGYEPSAGTHDLDTCKDWYIPGVDWWMTQRFGRAHGDGCYYRRPSQGFSNHIHGFTLPVNHRFATTVGIYIDGGFSLYGRLVTSSQLADYYAHRDALVGHAHDPSWFPKDINATIFNFNAWLRAQREALMEYKDWSKQSQQEMVKDVVDEFLSRKVSVRTPDNTGFEMVTMKQAIARGANATPLIRDRTSDVKDLIKQSDEKN